jgi:hypothetical protein
MHAVQDNARDVANSRTVGEASGKLRALARRMQQARLHTHAFTHKPSAHALLTLTLLRSHAPLCAASRSRCPSRRATSGAAWSASTFSTWHALTHTHSCALARFLRVLSLRSLTRLRPFRFGNSVGRALSCTTTTKRSSNPPPATPPRASAAQTHLPTPTARFSSSPRAPSPARSAYARAGRRAS